MILMVVFHSELLVYQAVKTVRREIGEIKSADAKWQNSVQSSYIWPYISDYIWLHIHPIWLYTYIHIHINANICTYIYIYMASFHPDWLEHTCSTGGHGGAHGLRACQILTPVLETCPDFPVISKYILINHSFIKHC